MNITIIGTGVMGGVITRAITKLNLHKIIVADHNQEKILQLEKEFSELRITVSNLEAIKNTNLIILAVKPQSFVEVAKELKGKIDSDCLVLSIMAGVKIRTIKKLLGVNKVVRTMPNLGAKVQKSMTVWTVTKEVNNQEKTKIIKILQSFGSELFVNNEKIIDKAGVVSGCGPGFFFYLVEEWINATKKLGFTREQAKELILKTIEASNFLLQQGDDPGLLREQVTSKGGTTEAGLKVFKAKNMPKVWETVFKASLKRTNDLSK